MHLHRFRSSAGFTMTELMMGLAVSTMMLSGLITSSVALQRSYKATEYYAAASADQVRALDYIARDARCALSVTYSSEVLTLKVPAFYSAYDDEGNPASDATPVDLSFTNSDVTYGAATEEHEITYSVNNGALIRKVKFGTQEAHSVIASEVDNFDFNFEASASTVTAQLSFSPRFKGMATSTDLKTTRSATIYMRNLNKRSI
ncbi:MAG TPA: hypothetical protein VF585_09950 [Chthoniobacterales bacterium]|jgi:Tfp pilus assembly protein PilW